MQILFKKINQQIEMKSMIYVLKAKTMEILSLFCSIDYII